MDPVELEKHLRRVLVGPRDERKVVLAEHDPGWKQRYEVEARRIEEAIPGLLAGPDHIGSTAVPGLIAKPIIDISVTVVDVDDDEFHIPALKAIGYHLRVREPDHRMFRSNDLGVHLHLWPSERDHTRHLVFLEWLQASAEGREAYADLKREVSSSVASMEEYSATKSERMSDLLSRAEQWAKAQG